jgi:hypothetical protein
MVNQEIEKDFEPFIKSLKKLHSDISEFMFDLQLANDYDDDISTRLFSIYKFLKKD